MSGAAGPPGERRPWTDEGDARHLAAALRSVAVAETDRCGLMVRPGRLPTGMIRTTHRQRIRAALEPLLSANRARLFRLSDWTSVVLWRGDAGGYLRHTLELLKRSVADLPRGVDDAVEMVTLLVLPRDTEVVLGVIEASMVAHRPAVPSAPASVSPASVSPASVSPSSASPSPVSPSSVPPSSLQSATELPEPGPARPAPGRDAPPGPVLAPLDLTALGTLERALAHADVAHLARRRAVCAAAPDSVMRLAWEKRFLSVAELAATLVPGHSPQAEPWLFRRLTRTLDHRMLALLSHPDELETAGPFSINLNAASILSPGFDRFDAALPARLRGEVVIDVTAADVATDLAGFVAARDAARARGYRLLLRGITADLLAVLRPVGLGVDLVQLRWSRELARLGAGTVAGHVGSMARVVLGGTDHQDAVDWGLQAGIRLFQGGMAQTSANQARMPMSLLQRQIARA